MVHITHYRYHYLSDIPVEKRRRSLMFGSLDNCEVLSHAPHLFIDGTFKSSPNLFKQLLSVHAYFDASGHRIPFVYGLLPGKTEALYTDFLSCLYDFTQFEPQSVLCDYEKGLHNAILTTWPSTSVRGYFFTINRRYGAKCKLLI